MSFCCLGESLGHIFLAGLMGCGKSSLARRIGYAFRLPVYDLDQRLETKYGIPIAQQVQEQGWIGFRQREWEELQLVCREPKGVVALGGGTLTIKGALTEIHRAGFSIFLDVSIPVLCKRVGNNPKRPLIAGCNSPAEVESLIRKLREERDRVYQGCDAIIFIDEDEPVTITTERLIALINTAKTQQ